MLRHPDGRINYQNGLCLIIKALDKGNMLRIAIPKKELTIITDNNIITASQKGFQIFSEFLNVSRLPFA